MTGVRGQSKSSINPSVLTASSALTLYDEVWFLIRTHSTVYVFILIQRRYIWVTFSCYLAKIYLIAPRFYQTQRFCFAKIVYFVVVIIIRILGLTEFMTFRSNITHPLYFYSMRLAISAGQQVVLSHSKTLQHIPRGFDAY
jgi:hypothetical protein